MRTGYARADHRAEATGRERPSEAPVSLLRLEKRSGVHGNLPDRSRNAMTFSLRKEVIQPQVLLRLPCYDFTPIMNDTLGGCLLAVSAPTSSTTHFRDVTGGVYKARERIHRSVMIRDY